VQNQLFEAALGIATPWSVNGVDFDAAKKTLTISVDFVAGTRFPAPGVAGVHPVHDTQIKRLRHLNFFQHECFLEVRTPRVKLPDGRVVLIEPDWFGQLAGFTLLFEALVLAMAQQMTFAAVAKLVGCSWHRVHAICSRYVDLALAEADLSAMTAVAIDETSCRRGHNYLTIAADMEERKVRVRHRGQGRQDRSRLRRTPDCAPRNARAGPFGEHRYVAGLHQRRERAFAVGRQLWSPVGDNYDGRYEGLRRMVNLVTMGWRPGQRPATITGDSTCR
jgi:hypothetical protein